MNLPLLAYGVRHAKTCPDPGAGSDPHLAKKN